MKRKQLTTVMTLVLGALMTAGCAYDYSDYIGAFNGSMYTSDFDMPTEQGGDKFDEFVDNPFVRTADECTSTFSVDADGAAYSIMRRYVNKDWKVDCSSVRIEEYLNYFTFDYADPAGSETVAINAEVGLCPWNAGHRLLRLGLKGQPIDKGQEPRANLVFLIDVSGSMDSPDKLELLKSGLMELLEALNPDDKISIITYSGEVKKLLEATRVAHAATIRKAISKLSANGSTAGGQAMKMAYEEALANYIEGGNNRVIMGTDGDFNVGVTNTDSLVKMVESYARKGIYLTCCGFGSGNLNDGMMETISNKGNGTYQYIDCEEEMMKVFVHEASKFVAVASDTKCQVTFDSTLVSRYRLIGYENRVMSNEDFEDDTKDAGEIGAGQTITALYEIVPTETFFNTLPSATAQRKVATFDVRYKKALGADSRPLTLDVTVGGAGADPSSENLRFAAGVAAYGMVLRQSEYRGDADIDMAIRLVDGARSFDPHGYRAELVKLMQKIKQSAWFNE